MDSDDTTIIEERSRHRGADPGAPHRSPPRGVDLGFRVATIILAFVLPPWGGFIVAVAMVVMETVVATAACRARLTSVLSGCNGGSSRRFVIGDEDGRFGL
jgi:hypothetical protein